MKFNENLKYLRKEEKMTQENLAERLNVSRQAVTKWESGQSLPDIENLKQIADLFGVTMDSKKMYCKQIVRLLFLIR